MSGDNKNMVITNRSMAYNAKLNERAKELRKNMTDPERKLWYRFLKGYKHRFLKQKIVDNYILDFYCAKAKLAIELDGSQHYQEDNIKYDEVRTKLLNAYGIDVIRFSNDDIRYRFEGVCISIEERLKKL